MKRKKYLILFSVLLFSAFLLWRASPQWINLSREQSQQEIICGNTPSVGSDGCYAGDGFLYYGDKKFRIDPRIQSGYSSVSLLRQKGGHKEMIVLYWWMDTWNLDDNLKDPEYSDEKSQEILNDMKIRVQNDGRFVMTYAWLIDEKNNVTQIPTKVEEVGHLQFHGNGIFEITGNYSADGKRLTGTGMIEHDLSDFIKEETGEVFTVEVLQYYNKENNFYVALRPDPDKGWDSENILVVGLIFSNTKKIISTELDKEDRMLLPDLEVLGLVGDELTINWDNYVKETEVIKKYKIDFLKN
ncbi:MAG: hypothetical protein OEV94_02050 [Deltaproteobacteria bacterium]|nr:hypothetical protein [Deltaproteobacteria bacterium]